MAKKSSIEIYNPRHVPFGELSNNYQYPLVIETEVSKTYQTPTNYIYSHLLTTPVYRLYIETAPIFPEKKNTNLEEKILQIEKNLIAKNLKVDMVAIRKFAPLDLEFSRMNIYQLFSYYLEAEYRDTVRSALETAYLAKVEQNPELLKLLLSSMHRPIVYQSGNQLMGVDTKGNGKNLLGVTLEQIRHSLQKKAVKKQEEEKLLILKDRLLTIYDAYRVVQDRIMEGDYYLQDLEGLSPDEIVDPKERDGSQVEYMKDYIYGEYMKPNPDENSLSSLLNRVLREPRFLVREVKKLYRKQLEEEMKDTTKPDKVLLKQRKRNIIVQAYLRHLIKEKYPKKSDRTVNREAGQLFDSYKSKMGDNAERTDYDDVVTKIVQMYEKAEFSETLMEKIDKLLKLPTTFLITGPTEDSESSDSDSDSEDSRSESSESERSESRSATSSESSSSSANPIKRAFTNNSGNIKWGVYEVKGDRKRGGLKRPLARGKPIILFKKEPSKSKLLKRLKEYNTTTGRNVKISEINIRPVTNRNQPPIEQPKADIPESEEEIIESLPIYISIKSSDAFNVFSPTGSDRFVVEGREYPSVSIFIMTSLLARVAKPDEMNSQKAPKLNRGMGIDNARSLLSPNGAFADPDTANEIYLSVYKESFEVLSDILASIALHTKFENFHFQSLLLTTGKRELIWADPNDIHLGAKWERGGYRGGNAVGKILMKIREKYQDKKLPITTISTGDIYEFIKDDRFMVGWISKKISDMCGTAQKIHRFSEVAQSILRPDSDKTPIDKNFVEKIVNTFFNPCSALSELDTIIGGKKPFLQFVQIVEKCHQAVVTRDYPKEFDELDFADDDGLVQNPNWTPQEVKRKPEFEQFITELQPSEGETRESAVKRSEKMIQRYTAPELPKRNFSKFEQKQLDEWTQFIDKITTRYPRAGAKKNIKKINAFIAKQREEWLEHEGVSQEALTPEQKKELKEINQQKRAKIRDLQKSLRDDIVTNIKNTEEIAEVYWSRIMVMLYFLLKNLQDSSDLNIKKAIIGLQQNLSETRDFTGPFNLPEKNVIANALINIVLGIRTVVPKKHFKNFLPSVLDLSVSILLNQNFKMQSKKTDLQVENEPKEEPEEDESKEEPEEDADLEPENEVGKLIEEPEEPEESEELEEESLEDIEEQEDFDIGDVSAEEGEFGFKGKKDLEENPETVEGVRMLLRRAIPDDEDLIEKLLPSLMKTISVVKTSKIQPFVKANRIAYFSKLFSC